MFRLWPVIGLVCLVPSVGMAQTKFSGTARCSKPDHEETIKVDDLPNRSFALRQGKCTWSKPRIIEGIQEQDGTYAGCSEISGDTFHATGYNIFPMANGDKIYYRYEVTATLKEGVRQNLEARWTIASGTGKFKDVKGNGIAHGREGPDGVTWEFEGEYQIAK